MKNNDQKHSDSPQAQPPVLEEDHPSGDNLGQLLAMLTLLNQELRPLRENFPKLQEIMKKMQAREEAMKTAPALLN